MKNSTQWNDREQVGMIQNEMSYYNCKIILIILILFHNKQATLQRLFTQQNENKNFLNAYYTHVFRCAQCGPGFT